MPNGQPRRSLDASRARRAARLDARRRRCATGSSARSPGIARRCPSMPSVSRAVPLLERPRALVTTAIAIQWLSTLAVAVRAAHERVALGRTGAVRGARREHRRPRRGRAVERPGARPAGARVRVSDRGPRGRSCARSVDVARLGGDAVDHGGCSRSPCTTRRCATACSRSGSASRPSPAIRPESRSWRRPPCWRLRRFRTRLCWPARRLQSQCCSSPRRSCSPGRWRSPYWPRGCGQ